MSPEENTTMLLIRLDQLTAEVAAEERLLLDQAAELGRVRREIKVARIAVSEMALERPATKNTKRRTA